MRTLAFALLCIARFSLAADGDLDTSFGTGGFLVQAPSDSSLTGLAVTTQNDGKIVVGGNQWQFYAPSSQERAAVWRLTPEGSLDTSFGSNGLTSVPFGTSGGYVYAVLALPDDSVLASGYLGGYGVMRLLADGTLDPKFGNAGVALIDFSDLGITAHSALGLAVDSQGRILVAGGGSVTGYQNWGVGVVARLAPTGALDTGFGTGGRAVVQFGDSTTQPPAVFLGVAVDSTDRVWLSGNGNPTQDPSVSRKFLAARLDANGNLDPNFGSTGIVTATFAATVDNRGAHSVLRDNRLTIGGTCDALSGNASFCLLRLLEDGTADASFGASGWADVSVSGSLRPYSSIACQSDGRCLVLSAGALASNTHRQFVVTRVDAAGAADTTFGTAGVARIDILTTGDGSHIEGRAIALQGGRPVLAGSTDGIPSIDALLVTRLAGDQIFNNGFE